MRKMIWLGPAFTIAEALSSAALAPAASRWQEGFLRAIVDAGVDVHIVTSRAERVWPRGPMRVAGAQGTFYGIPRNAVTYVNLPRYRSYSLATHYRAAIDQACADTGCPDLIASYNVAQPVATACRYATRRLGVPWIPVLLDHDRPSPGWGNVLSGTEGAAGVVFLSHWAYINAPVNHKLHLDAGVTSVPATLPTPTRSRILLYTGALHRWGGVETLLEALPLIRTPDVRLVVIGRGAGRDLLRRLNSTPAVEYLGGVDEPTLARLTEQAEVLANPRPSGVQGNEMNFPSKLIHYLSSLKPVATTMTLGVAPEYRDVVIAAADDSAEAFATAVDRAFAMTESEKLGLAKRIDAFLRRDRLWSNQARRFIEWTECVISNTQE